MTKITRRSLTHQEVIRVHRALEHLVEEVDNGEGEKVWVWRDPSMTNQRAADIVGDVTPFNIANACQSGYVPWIGKLQKEEQDPRDDIKKLYAMLAEQKEWIDQLTRSEGLASERMKKLEEQIVELKLKVTGSVRLV